MAEITEDTETTLVAEITEDAETTLVAEIMEETWHTSELQLNRKCGRRT